MGDGYLWVKVVHVLAFVSWMAGLFYLPRLFVYHVERRDVSGLGGVFEIMERRLLKAIMRPAAVVTFVAGILLIWLGNWHDELPVWLWLKLGLVVLMAAYHGLLEVHAVRLREGREARGGRYFRMINEIPTVLLILIVVLVVVKPF